MSGGSRGLHWACCESQGTTSTGFVPDLALRTTLFGGVFSLGGQTVSRSFLEPSQVNLSEYYKFSFLDFAFTMVFIDSKCLVRPVFEFHL